MKLLAIDPGLHLGVARRDNDGSLATIVITEDHFDWLAQHLNGYDVIIIEQFLGTQHLDKYRIQTIELVGAVCAIAAIYHTKLIRHSPGDRKPCQREAHDYFLKNKIKHMIHEEDALAHLFYYERTKR